MSGAIEGYRKMGGLTGYTEKVLLAELEKARHDEGHVLHPVITLFNENKKEDAGRLLVNIVLQADPNSILGGVPQMYINLLLAKEALAFADKNVNDPDRLEGLPAQIILWAGVGAGVRESKAAGGRGKGKKWKEKVLSEWGKSGKKLSIPNFAKRFFEKNGGKYSESGGKEGGDVPSIRTIERYLRVHERTRQK